MKKKLDVAIIGGGLAGLSAAVYLADQNQKIALFESKSQLGGRTSCWMDNGMQLESGLHRYLGMYEEMPKVLKKAGIDLEKMLIWTDEIEIRLPGAREKAAFGMSIFHEPTKTLLGLLGNNEFLSLDQKTSIASFFAKGFSQFKKNPVELDTYTVLEYAEKSELSTDTIKKILVPLTEGLFFLGIEHYSAYHLFALFAPYLTKMHKVRVGAFRGCMSSAMIQPLEKYLIRNGVAIYKNTTVDALSRYQGGWQLRCAAEFVQANTVVLATPMVVAQQLLADYANENTALSRLQELDSMPTVCIQIELQSPSLDTDSVVFSPQTILASYTEQSRTTFPNSNGRFSAILSNPEKLLSIDDVEVLQRVLQDAKKLDINLSKQNIIEYRVNRWEDDFYSYERNMYDKRPPTDSSLPGLVLAGDYIDQKYMQTMEGAVYSGRLAADKILQH